MFNDYGISASLSYDDDPLSAIYNFFFLDAGTKTTVNAKIEEVPFFFKSIIIQLKTQKPRSQFIRQVGGG